MTSGYGIESGGLLYNRLTGILFSDKRNQRMFRQGDRVNNGTRWMKFRWLNVTFSTVVYSVIQLTRAPACTACGGPGALDTAVPPRQWQRSKKIGYLFQILLCDLLLSMDLPPAGAYRILKHISVQRGRSSSSGELLGVEVCQPEWRISFSIMQR